MLNDVPLIGPFAQEWQQSFDKIKNEIEEVDISSAISVAALSVKDENELVGRPQRKLRLR